MKKLGAKWMVGQQSILVKTHSLSLMGLYKLDDVDEEAIKMNEDQAGFENYEEDSEEDIEVY